MFKRVSALLTLATVSVLAGLALINFQYIQDVASYHQYQPDALIASLASDAGMSEQGKFLFYTSHPSLEQAEAFNRHCGKTEKTTAILGCYDGRQIYIFNIQDERLSGIRPTTAAHEMLHAAYARLDSEDKQEVDLLLEKEFESMKSNTELADRMAFYERTQPGERLNELHSIIGTEVENISSELERYYVRYFSDRSKVISQRTQYYSLFEELRERSNVLKVQIDNLDTEIKNDRVVYDAEYAKLKNDTDSFKSRADTGDFDSQAAFNSERQILLVRSAELENLRIKINSMITRRNKLVEELNAIAIETEELNRSIDSNLTPAPSV